jgi:ribosomal protein L21E
MDSSIAHASLVILQVSVIRGAVRNRLARSIARGGPLPTFSGRIGAVAARNRAEIAVEIAVGSS